MHILVLKKVIYFVYIQSVNYKNINKKTSLSGSNITKYSGLNTVAKYMNRQNIVKTIGKSFHTVWYNATRFSVN